MALSFLPRGIAAKRAPVSEDPIGGNDQPEQMQLDTPASPSSTSTGAYSNKQTSPYVPRKQKTQNQPSQSKGGFYQHKSAKPIKLQELCVLIETSMSDYALWSNADLRRYATDRNTNGYISLSRLLNESPLIQATGQPIAEPSVFQALKDYGTGFLELQLKLTTAARNRQKAGDNALYNIRRVDWDTIREKPDPSYVQNGEDLPSLWDRSEEAWNERTIYVENIPRKYWTLPAALWFMQLCAEPASNAGEQLSSTMEMDAKAPHGSPTIQHFELPAHAKASQTDVPVCKGFCFVTFSEVTHAERVLSAWPWTSSRQITKSGHSKDANEDEAEEEDVGEQLMNLDLTKEKDERVEVLKEGSESHLRSISLKDWEELKKQYLAWQAELYESMKPTESRGPKSGVQITPHVRPAVQSDIPRTKDAPPHLPPTEKSTNLRKAGPTLTAHSETLGYKEASYPSGCLLFVKNLHPQTNKTTLKKLFEHALESASSTNEVKVGEIDYVDWS
ncbi:hypothetical protein M408DRAFT_305460, partial [Serendipita vermifera MAFF 305830]